MDTLPSTEPELSCRITRTLLMYVREENNGSLGNLLEGLELDESYLMDDNNWISHDFMQTLYRRMIEILGDEDAVYKMAIATMRFRSFGILDRIARLINDPKIAYSHIPKYNRMIRAKGDVFVHELGDSWALVEERYHDGSRKTHYDCDYMRGVLAGIPTFFHMPVAHVEEIECQVSVDMYGDRTWPDAPVYGAKGCLYRVRFASRGPASFWKRVFRRRQAYQNAVEDLLDANQRIQEKYNEARKLTFDLAEANKQLVLSKKQFESKSADLEVSERQYRLLAENATDTIWVLNLETMRFDYISPSVQKLMGFSAEEAMEVGIERLIVPESLEKALNRLSEEMNKEKTGLADPGRSEAFELLQRRKDGTHVWVEAKMNFIRDEHGRPMAIQGVSRDISERKQAEEARKRTKATLRGVFLAAPVGLCTMQDQTFQTANRAWYEITGYTEEEIIGKTPHMLSDDEEEFKRVERELYDGAPKNGVNTVRTKLRRKDGVYRDLVLRAAPLNREGLTDLTIVAIEDVTDRILTERALRESEEMYRTLMDTSPDAIVVFSLSGELIAVSRQTARIYGVESVEEFLEEVRTVFDLLTEEGKAAAAVNIPTVITRGLSRGNEYEIRIRGGKTIVMEMNTSVIKDMDGNPKAFISVLRDITEKKLADKILRIQQDLGMALARAVSLEESLELCLEAAVAAAGCDAGGIYIRDPASGSFSLQTVTGISREYAEELRRYEAGSERAMLLDAGSPIYLDGAAEMTALNLADAVAEGMQSAALIPIHSQDQVIGGFTLGARYPNGIPTTVRDTLETIGSRVGSVIARLQAEQLLRESERKFRDLTEKSLVGIYLLQDRRFKYVNEEMTNIFGHTAEEMIDHMGLQEVIYPEDLPLLVQNVRQQNARGFKSMHHEFRIVTREGEVRNVEMLGSRTLYQGRPAVIGTLLDITERHRAQEELQRLSTAVEQAAEDIIITDPEGIIQYVNPAFEKITGYSRAEAIGRNPRFLQSGRHDSAFYKRLWDTLRDGRIWTGHLIDRRKDGDIIEEDTTISPLTTSTGKLMGYVALKRDVTETVRIEAQLRQAQKMEAIGVLAGGIAHDFNNILGALMGYAELAKLKTTDKGILPHLERILKACDRSRDLIKQILDFSRQGEYNVQPVSVIPIVKEAMKLLRSTMPATVEIRQVYNTSHDMVLTDPTQIHQVLVNLCTNALYAMRNQEGVLEVRIEEQQYSGEGPPGAPQLKEGGYLQITVSDTGEGIDPAWKDRIFEPFFTTKKVGEGTGLGLSVVYGIVRDCGGAITIDSEPSRGTAVTIYLPLLDADSSAKEEKTEEILRGRGRILLVDDEEPIASLGQEILSSLGYEVDVRYSSNDALEAFQAHPDRYDLVITDMTMPNMTGAGLARELLKIRPDLPIILTTGYSDRIDEEQAKKIGFREFLMKPVSLIELSRVVKEQLAVPLGAGDPPGVSVPEKTYR
ncbi:MAG: PAS domain S-box protein [Smithellaceae bacterium]|jgi:PAS domain S-box-containing protein|nr:PAS domain S-box protein [Syntrophaceae bacterium]